MTEVWVRTIGTVLGSNKVDVKQLVEDFGPVREGFLERTGFESLYESAPDESSRDLALKAIDQLPDGSWKNDVDTLISVTSTSDLQAPGNAHLIQAEAEFPPGIVTLDLNDACTGFVRALHLAESLVAAGSSQTTLITIADTYTKLFAQQNLKLSPLFSDGASAIVVTGKRPADPAGWRHWVIRSRAFVSEGDRAIDLEIRRDATGTLGELEMNGSGVMNFVLKHARGLVAKLGTDSGIDLSTVDRWYVHQGSAAVVSGVSRVLGANAEELFVSSGYGNTVGSSLPFQLHAESAPAEGSRIIGLLAFGVGLTMAGMLIEEVAEH